MARCWQYLVGRVSGLKVSHPPTWKSEVWCQATWVKPVWRWWKVFQFTVYPSEIVFTKVWSQHWWRCTAPQTEGALNFCFYKGNVSLHVFIVWNKYSKPRHFFYLAHHLVAARTSPGYTRVRETLLEVFWETKSFFSILCAIKQHACGVYDNHSVKKRTETWIISLPAVCY